jgi:hypothetical protein
LRDHHALSNACCVELKDASRYLSRAQLMQVNGPQLHVPEMTRYGEEDSHSNTGPFTPVRQIPQHPSRGFSGAEMLSRKSCSNSLCAAERTARHHLLHPAMHMVHDRVVLFQVFTVGKHRLESYQ